MNLEETASVTLGTLGTSTLQTASLGAANSPAPASVQSVSSCRRASPVFGVLSPTCKGRATAVHCGRKVQGGWWI